MFGLSHEQLRAAGEALADAEDDAGRMLFGAALDGTSLQQTLERMEVEAKATSSAMRDALKKYHEKRKASSDAALPIKVWADLNTDVDRAEADAQSSAERLRNGAAEIARLQRIQKVLPLLARRTELLQQRSDLGDIRILAPEVTTTRRELLREKDQMLAPEIERIQNRIDQLQQERDALSIPKELLAESDRIRRLKDQLGQYRKERMDLPGVTRSIIELEDQERKNLSELGLGSLALADIESIRIDEAARKRTQDLDRMRTACESELQQLRRQIAAKQVAGKQCVEKLASLPAPPDVNSLKSAWDQLAERTIDDKLRRSEAALRDLDAEVERTRSATVPWAVLPAQALTLAVPPDEALQMFAEREQDERHERRGAEKAAHEAKAEVDKAERELRQLASLDVTSQQDLEVARKHRQKGWDHILKAWKKGTPPTLVVASYASGEPLADAYADAVRKADDLADKRRQDADRSARLEGLRHEQEQAQQRLSEATKVTAAIDARMRDRTDEWNKLWAPSGLQPGSPREMAGWKKRFESFQDSVRQREVASRAHEELRRVLVEQQRALELALTAVKTTVSAAQSWKELCALVQQAIGQTEAATGEIARIRAEHETIERDLKTLEVDEETARNKSLVLDTEWGEAVARLRLRPQATGAEAVLVLDKLTSLFTTDEKRRPQDARRRAIYKQQVQFEAAVVDLVKRFAPEFLPAHLTNTTNDRRLEEIEKDTIDKLAVTLIDLHEAGARDEVTQARLAEDLRKSAIELNQSEERLKVVRRQLEALLLETGCDSVESLMQAERRSDEARIIDNDLKQTHEKILIAGDGKTIHELEKAAAEDDPDRIAARFQEAGIAHSVLEREHHDALTRLGEQRGRKRGQDGRGEAARLDGEAQEYLATARAHAVRHARLQVGALVLQRAVDSYRRKNESAILRRAESLFQRLTLGRYGELRVEYEAGKAKLRAVRPGEEVDVARSLSDGTLDQLFLSLRLASIEQHLASQEAMPLVLDDIFINFDDDRTRAGIEVLAEFAAKTQVLLLTHHARTLELAKKALMESAWMEHRLDPDRI
jgi:uncharacterized protein YhaN